jgi:hypothetical protein
MSDVFLSYARDDAPFAEKLAKLLEASKLDVWWDRRLLAGDDFNAEIEKALTDARCVVVLWSPLSVDSKWVRGEAQRALDAKKLIPIMIAPCRLPINFGQLLTPQVYQSAAQLDDLAHQLTSRLKDRPTTAPGLSGSPGPHGPVVASEVVFSPTAAHTFFEDLNALQKNPGRTVRERMANNWAMWKRHPLKMSLFLAGIGLLGGVASALFQLYQANYGDCPESGAQMLNQVQLFVAQSTQQYAVDGDEAAFLARSQQADEALGLVPRQCLLVPSGGLPAAAPALACPQVWSAYEQCVERRKKDIVAGRPLPLCVEPACPRR